MLVSSSFTIHYALERSSAAITAGLKLGLGMTWLLGATFLFIQINEYVHIGFSAPRPRLRLDLLRPHRTARRARLRRPVCCSPSPASAPSAATSARAKEHLGVEVPGHLLALRGHHVDRRLRDGLHHLRRRNRRRRRPRSLACRARHAPCVLARLDFRRHGHPPQIRGSSVRWVVIVVAGPSCDPRPVLTASVGAALGADPDRRGLIVGWRHLRSRRRLGDRGEEPDGSDPGTGPST